jgi:hypothetical protein
MIAWVVLLIADATLTTATVAAATSIVAAAIAAIVAVITERSRQNHALCIKNLEDTAQERYAKRNARRDYEYDARKKLYLECEPLLFQFVELGERAIGQIELLAAFSRSRELEDDSRNAFRNTYFRSATVYRLFAPLVVFSLMQRILTLVDLSLDPRIKAYYELSKILFASFRDDLEIARAHPPIPDYGAHSNADRQKAGRQVVVYGNLTNAAEQLIVEREGGKPRCMTFGEFETYFATASHNTSLEAVSDFIVSINPRTRPVAWRILIAQFIIYKTFHRLTSVRSEDIHGKVTFDFVSDVSASDRERLDWRSHDEASDTDVLAAPFEGARNYIRSRLSGYPL